MQGQKPSSFTYDYSTKKDSKPKDRPVTIGEQLELDERKRIDRLDEDARKRKAYVAEGAGTESSIHGDTFEGRQEYIPLQQRSNSPYPIQSLPAPAQRYVRNLANYTDTDPAMPAQFLLGFVSGCNRKQLVARVGSYTRPVNLGICNFAASTTGKSFVLREIQREFLSAQKQISQDMQSVILDRKRQRKTLQNTIDKTQSRLTDAISRGIAEETGLDRDPIAALTVNSTATHSGQEGSQAAGSMLSVVQTDDPKTQTQLTANNPAIARTMIRIREMEDSLAKLPELHGPDLFFTQISPEDMISKMVRQNGCCVIAGSELKVISEHIGCSAGFKSRAYNGDNLASGLTNEDMRSNHKCDKESMDTLAAGNISMIVAVQDDVRKTFTDEIYGQGLFGRILWAWITKPSPEAVTANRVFSDDDRAWVNDLALRALRFSAVEYCNRDTVEVTGSEDAISAWEVFANAARNRAAQYEMTEPRMATIAARAQEQVMRIAGTLRFLECLCDKEQDLNTLPLSTLNNAIAIFNWHEEQAKLLLESEESVATNNFDAMLARYVANEITKLHLVFSKLDYSTHRHEPSYSLFDKNFSSNELKIVFGKRELTNYSRQFRMENKEFDDAIASLEGRYAIIRITGARRDQWCVTGTYFNWLCENKLKDDVDTAKQLNELNNWRDLEREHRQRLA